MPEKRCPKCGKTFEDSWKLCDECGIELVAPAGAIASASFISKIRGKLGGLDRALDSKISRAVDKAEGAKESLDGIRKKATVKATEVTEKAGKTAEMLEKKSLDITKKMRYAGSADAVIDTVLDRPHAILIAVLVITVIIGAIGIPPMMNAISGELTIYLPQDDEAAKILNEVNEDWSTEMIVLFVETPNKFDITYGNDYNITHKNVLDEMSKIEEALDPNKEDYGGRDEISFVLSISTLIKEIHSSPKKIGEAVGDELGISLIGGENMPGEYTIPDDQEDIDRIVNQIPEDTLKLLVIDTNDDGIWDSAGIIMGVRSKDQETLMKEVYKLIDDYYIDTRAEKGDHNHIDEWWERVEAGEVHCTMTPTGPVPMTVALTERTYKEFSVVVPAALGLICVALFLLHRTPKIVLISCMPIFCSLVITLGIMGLTGWELSPQVILIAPILLALGVAYGLYIANRYSDERQNIKDKKERMRVAIKTTGKAIFLSAVTTAVGFSSLMFVDMIPLKILGFGLTAGIMICYAVTMLTVPSLVMLLSYEKRGKMRSAEKIGRMPMRHKRKIVVAAIVITIISISLIPSIQANMNFTEMAPQDEPTVIKMDQYSEEFGGGQMGMVLVRGNPAPKPGEPDQHLKGKGSMKDIDVLDGIESMENWLKEIKDPPINAPISVVDVMKMIKIPDRNSTFYGYLPPLAQQRIDEFMNTSFWDAIHLADDETSSPWGIWYGKSKQDSIINIFYNSISTEMRGFLVNIDYSKALVYIDMPSMDAVKMEAAVDQVNEVTEEHPVGAGTTTSHLTGFAAILVAVNNLIMFNSMLSLFIALIVVFFVLIIIFRSLRYAALTMIPVCMVVAWIPLTLGVTGIDLNLITAMIGSILVGIGIDYGIHMTERIKECGENPKGIKKAVETSGFTFFEATITIVAGLLSIFLINVRSIQEFITMVILLLIFSMVGAMLILPSIYAWLSAEKEEKAAFKSEVAEVEPE